jgi:hypothetical protein
MDFWRNPSETTAHVAGFGFSNEGASAPSLLPLEKKPFNLKLTLS